MGQRVATLLSACLAMDQNSVSRQMKSGEGPASILLAGGTGPLVWSYALAHAPTADSSEFQQAYRLARLRGAVAQKDLAALFPLMREHGVEPVVVKGWSVARHYTDLALRPYTDLDIGISPVDEERGRAVLRDPRLPKSTNIDLHHHFQELDDLRWEDLMSRSQLIELDGIPIRVLGHEDHLRLLCLHFAKHGGYRPLWLCDIAVIMVGRKPIDWDLLLSGDRTRARWVVAIIQLARELLDVRVNDDASPEFSRPLPRWVLPSVLREWGDPWRWPGRHSGFGESIRRNPLSVLRETLRRWPGPVEASFNRRAPVNELPRFPFQVAELISKVPAVLRQLTKRP